VRFHTDAGDLKKTLDVPAGQVVYLPTKDLLRQSAPYGGTFVDLLEPYLFDPQKKVGRYSAITDKDWARAALPPPLIREGEKVQPAWLYQFLRNPGKVRPQERDGGVLVLRMPRFNMSDEEAMALVNYFAAADRMGNPGESLNYPYLAVKQREKEFWREQTADYLRRLGQNKPQGEGNAVDSLKLFQKDLQDRLKEAEEKLKEANAEFDKAEKAKDEAAKKKADETRKLMEQYVNGLKAQLKENDLPALERQWRESGVYGTEAYRMLMKGAPCLTCHQVNNVGVNKGPPLDLAAERLRPEWTLHWLANPRRMITYATPMPSNFVRTDAPYPQMPGLTTEEQLRVMRDLLMNLPDVASKPANRYLLTSPGGK
jgi:hypothetical protein